MGRVREKVVEELKQKGYNLLTPEEVATLANNDVVTIYRHIREGKLRARRVVGALRCEMTDVLTYLDGSPI
jgi:excisionase family DNA binding protein